MKVYLLFSWLFDGHVVGIFPSVEAAQIGAAEHAATREQGVLQAWTDQGHGDLLWANVMAPDFEYSYAIEEFELGAIKPREWEKVKP